MGTYHIYITLFQHVIATNFMILILLKAPQNYSTIIYLLYHSIHTIFL